MAETSRGVSRVTFRPEDADSPSPKPDSPNPDTQLTNKKPDSPNPDTQLASYKADSPNLETQLANHKTESPNPDTQLANHKVESPSPDTQLANQKPDSPNLETQLANHEVDSPNPDTQLADHKADSTNPGENFANSTVDSPTPKLDLLNPEVDLASPYLDCKEHSPNLEVDLASAEVDTSKPDVDSPISEAESPNSEVDSPNSAVESPSPDQPVKIFRWTSDMDFDRRLSLDQRASIFDTSTRHSKQSVSDSKLDIRTDRPRGISREFTHVKENTYQLGPTKMFSVFKAKKAAESVVNRWIKPGEIYSAERAANMAKQIAADVQKAVKRMDCDRYKFVVKVLIGEKKGQGLLCTSRTLSDAETDSSATYTFENKSMCCVVTVYAMYFE